MYHVSAQGVDEPMINVHYYYYYYLLQVLGRFGITVRVYLQQVRYLLRWGIAGRVYLLQGRQKTDKHNKHHNKKCKKYSLEIVQGNISGLL